MTLECRTEGKTVRFGKVRFAPKDGLKYVNGPIVSRDLDRYPGPEFYHLSAVSMLLRINRGGRACRSRW